VRFDRGIDSSAGLGAYTGRARRKAFGRGRFWIMQGNSNVVAAGAVFFGLVFLSQGSVYAASSSDGSRQPPNPSQIEALNRAFVVAVARGAYTKSEKSLCINSVVNLCLLGRFVVVAVWDNPYVDPTLENPAGALQLTSESGYLYFQGAVDMEVPIKILDYCGSSGVFKIFAAGLSDFGVTIGVKDLVSGTQINYTNPDFQTFNTIIDEDPPFPCP
jgi:hypothetical protein